ncbi:hypothetical protein [Lactococcus phage P1048]|uniref:Uncharacterized protein n=1 Tax=Lactococcus phage P1048 TaxID=2662295 RepID=A0A649V209_9CAUD|nr:hypothetical protein H1Z36_gp030 [Lactococcus phage P1048]QGJ84911.1 hypothetical protein [Lactococcus phage P1048]
MLQIFETKLILFEIGIFQTKPTFRIEFLKRDSHTPTSIGVQISQTNPILFQIGIFQTKRTLSLTFLKQNGMIYT